jgi:hypothetical protein
METILRASVVPLLMLILWFCADKYGWRRVLKVAGPLYLALLIVVIAILSGR